MNRSHRPFRSTSLGCARLCLALGIGLGAAGGASAQSSPLSSAIQTKANMVAALELPD